MISIEDYTHRFLIPSGESTMGTEMVHPFKSVEEHKK